MSAPPRVGEGGFGKQLKGPVVVDLSAVQNAAVPVGGVFAHAHVGDEIEFGKVPFGQPQRLLHRALVVPRARAAFVLMRGQPEEQHGGHPRLPHLFKLHMQHVGAVAELPVERGDRLGDLPAPP